MAMTPDDILLEAEDKMNKTEQVFITEVAGVRTGKASASLVENIVVEVYGSQMRIRELAGITTPEPRMLMIQPWDHGSNPPMQDAHPIATTPAVQGKFIRLVLPDLSTEQREKFVKACKKMAEDGRISVRNVRRDAMEQLKKHAHDSGVSADEVKQAEKDMQ